jgi:hypothetical protein
MTPYYNTPYTNPQNDYENFDFWSPMNVWSADNKLTERIQFLDFDVLAGRVLFLPPYWWYSIQFCNDDTQMYIFKYSTYFNVVAHANHWFHRFFPPQNPNKYTNEENENKHKFVEYQKTGWAKRFTLYETENKNETEETDEATEEPPPPTKGPESPELHSLQEKSQ